MDYKSSGVDVKAGRSFVDSIKETVKSTHRPEVMGGFGGFNGMMRIPSGYEKPVLVSGTDGVGTKLYTAQLEGCSGEMIHHYNVGIDLVAMCINDVITCGAEPLFFLDYIATGNLNPNTLINVVGGISDACNQCGCSLLGGETAEMPRMYQIGRYDLAGFCVGVVEESEIVDGTLIKPGDKVIGLASNGIHSNGFSLINDMLWRNNLSISKPGPERENDIANILTPTKLYYPIIKKLREEIPILGMAHITGGGIPENLPRCLPEGLRVEVDYDSWPRPEIFKKIAKDGDVSEEEMRNVFNLGIGYCLVVPAAFADVMIPNSWVIGDVHSC